MIVLFVISYNCDTQERTCRERCGRFERNTNDRSIPLPRGFG